MVTPGAQGYAVAAAGVEEDGARVLALWKNGLGHSGMPQAKFDWFYRRNPEGMPRLYFLLHGERREPVGVAAVAPRRMRHGGVTRLAGEMVDFVVHPDHRTLFPALLLQKAVRRDALEDGAHALLYGLPNPKSAAVFARVRYARVGQMVRRARVLRFGGYLSRYLPRALSGALGAIADRVHMGAIAWRRSASRGFRSQWVARPDPRFDDLWQRVPAQEVLMGVRDAKFLTWRFAECPLRAYRFFTLVTTEDERLAAYAVCEAWKTTLHVRDFLVDPARAGAGPRLWLDLSLEAFRLGCTSLSLEFLGGEPIVRELEKAGMTPREQRPLYAAATGDWQNLVQDRDWYLTCADEDT